MSRDTALARLGWRAHHRRSLQAGPEGLLPARVLARDRGRVLVHDGHDEHPAPIAGRLRHTGAPGDLPVAGDWVALAPGGAVQAVLERHGVLRRAGQVLAAGVDVVLVAHALAEDPRDKRLPRFLALAADAGAPAVVAMTKADLLGDVPAGAERVRAAAGGAVPVLAVSTVDGTGLEAVRALAAPGTTVALVGASGAGKSTLVNALLGRSRQRTGAVRASDGRGRHVTVRRELVELPGGGLLLDTPGLRLVRVRAQAGEAYGDVAELAAACRFSDCSHGAEPGCAVRAAIEGGELEPARLRAWQRLEREAAYAAAREDEALQRARDRRSREVVTAHRREQRRRRRAKGGEG